MIKIGLVDIGSDTEMRIFFRQQYIDRLIEVGASVHMISPTIFSELDETKKDAWVGEQLDECQGLLLPGGADINPSFWNASKESWCGEINSVRDELEQKLFLEAKKRVMPVFGICRGIQAINVFSGGSLYQDVRMEHATVKDWHDDRVQKAGRVHGVEIEKDSELYRLLRMESVRVNSMHHQAIKEVAESFVVTAKSEDGLIEGIEYCGDWFCLGVQWHPEHMAVNCPEQRLLFEGFLKQCEQFSKNRVMTEQELLQMPKIELHCHLDGSLSQSLIENRLKREVSKEELCVSESCSSLIEYLDKFRLPGLCIQDEEGLELAAMDVLEQMSKENVIYAEIRFAPMLSVTEKMDVKQVISAVLRGLKEGKKRYGVDAQAILCLMRHHSVEQNMTVVEAAGEFLGKGVCAIDLAGSEKEYPMEAFLSLFGEVKKKQIPFTLHAGECGSAKNIQDSMLAGASRIGHGIAMRGQEEIKNIVKEARAGVEMCPISNLQTKSVNGPEEYPLREFLKEGLLVTINTDNRTVSDTSLTKEFAAIQALYQVTREEILTLTKNAVQVAFLSEEEKETLYEKIRNFERNADAKKK